MSKNAEDERIDQAAILLFGMGEQHAAEILKHFDQKQVEKLISSMNKLENISEKDVVKALNGFYQESNTHTGIGVSSNQYIRKTLINAVGNEKAESMLDRAALGEQARGLEILSWQGAQIICDLIQDEHPQVIAITLTYLDSDKAAEILQLLPTELRVEVIRRLTLIGPIAPIGLDQLARVMEKRLNELEKFKELPIGGIDTTADIVNFLDSEVEHEVLELISAEDEELATKIQERMFPFERIGSLDDKIIQTILREVQNEDLVYALKGVDPEVQDAFFRNMSGRASDMLKDDMESKGPVQLQKVQDAQKRVVAVTQKMAKEGVIVIATGSGDGDMVE